MPAPKYLGLEYPHVLLRWHPSANGGIDPSLLISRSPSHYWWVCELGHSYQATVRSLIDGRQCRVCLGVEISSGVNDFETLYPELAKHWFQELNGDVFPNQVGVGGKTKYWWKCDQGHEYQSDIWNKIKGKRCRTCAGYVAVSGESDVPTKFPHLNSLFMPGINGVTTLESVHPGSEIVVGWKCELGHQWSQAIREVVRKKKGHCSVCSNESVLTGFNDLQSKHPELADEWDFTKNAPILPSDVLFQTDKLFSWRCKSHGHEWSTSPFKRIREKSNCPYCSNYSLLVGFNDLATANPNLAEQWSTRNSLQPSDVIVGSHKKFWWKCPENHEWYTTVQARISSANRPGTGCPECTKYGFDPGKPADLYFLSNDGFSAMKIGITNSGTTRIRGFAASGWKLLHKERFNIGGQARIAEKIMHDWLKNELALGQAMSRKDIGRLGGETETFSASFVSEDQVRKKLTEVCRVVRNEK